MRPCTSARVFLIGFVMPDNCSCGCLFAGLQLKRGKLDLRVAVSSWLEKQIWFSNLLNLSSECNCCSPKYYHTVISGSCSLVLGIKYVQVHFCCNKAKKNENNSTLRVFSRPTKMLMRRPRSALTFRARNNCACILWRLKKRPCCLKRPLMAQKRPDCPWLACEPAGLTCCRRDLGISFIMKNEEEKKKKKKVGGGGGGAWGSWQDL